MSDEPTIGERIIHAVVEGSLMRMECSHDAEHGCLAVWSPAAADQINAMVAEAGWIDARQRLPKCGEWIIACFKDRVFATRKDGSTEVHLDWFTHWQPLPAAPAST